MVSKYISVGILLLCLMPTAQAQDFMMYDTSELRFYSPSVGDTFAIDLMLPESLKQSAGMVGYPLILLLDSQNRQTHLYNRSTIDLLTMHSQMPEAVVAGIPFTMQNRYHLTVWNHDDGAKGGIKKTEAFIFDELVPVLQAQYVATGPLIILGHSRTGYLTSYLMINRYTDFEMAGSFSGFFETGFTPAEINRFFEQTVTMPHPFSFYFSAGTTREEEIYYRQYERLYRLLNAKQMPSGFTWKYFIHEHANHITNYNLSVAPVLVDYFAPFNTILDDWLFSKLVTTETGDALNLLKYDLGKLEEVYGKKMAPAPVHIYSLASHYIGINEYAPAIEILNYGRLYYPHDYELDYLTAETLTGAGNTDDAKAVARDAIAKIQSNRHITEAEKQSYIGYFTEFEP